MRFKRLGIYFGIFSLFLIIPYFSITGFDIIGFDPGGEGEIGVGSDPSGNIPTIELDVPTVSGGGGGGSSFSLDPTNFNINLIVNTNIEKIITIINLGSQKNLAVSQEGLDGMIILESDFINLGSFESKNFSVTFVALSQPGTFVGKIKIGGKEILVSFDVKSKLLLFDSNIVILNNDYIVKQGKELKTEVTLTPLGDRERLDVTLNYAIKNFEGKVFLTKSETFLIEDKKTFKLNFDTGLLPLGDYVIELELVYPNGVATSSASFKVVEEIPFSSPLVNIFYYLIMATLICAILLVGVLLQEVTREKENNLNFHY